MVVLHTDETEIQRDGENFKEDAHANDITLNNSDSNMQLHSPPLSTRDLRSASHVYVDTTGSRSHSSSPYQRIQSDTHLPGSTADSFDF